MISFVCPKCAQQYQTSEDKAGKRTKCARCNELLVVPVPDQMWWRQSR